MKIDTTAPPEYIPSKVQERLDVEKLDRSGHTLNLLPTLAAASSLTAATLLFFYGHYKAYEKIFREHELRIKEKPSSIKIKEHEKTNFHFVGGLGENGGASELAFQQINRKLSLNILIQSLPGHNGDFDKLKKASAESWIKWYVEATTNLEKDNTPFISGGFSTGGLVTAAALPYLPEEHYPKALVFAGVPFQFSNRRHQLILKISEGLSKGKGLKRTLAESLSFPIYLNPEEISIVNNPQRKIALLNRISTTALGALPELSRMACIGLTQVKCPVYFIYGENDHYTCLDFISKIPNMVKTKSSLHIVPGGPHAILATKEGVREFRKSFPSWLREVLA